MIAKVNSVSYMVEYKNNEGVEKRSHIVKRNEDINEKIIKKFQRIYHL